MLEGVDLPVLYAPVSGIIYLHIIIAIASAEEIPSKILVFPILNKVFILAYHINTWNGSKQMAKTSIKFNLIKKDLYLGNQIKSEGKTCCKFWYDLLRPILTTVKIIISPSVHSVFTRVNKNYKYFLAVETDDILMET